MSKLINKIKTTVKKRKSSSPGKEPTKIESNTEKTKEKSKIKEDSNKSKAKTERTDSRSELKVDPGKSEQTPPSSPKGKSENGEDDILTELCSVSSKVSAADFELLKVIGRGSFGKVMQVRHIKTGDIYAMKVMRKDHIVAKHQVNHTKDERHILQKISHPFIVKLNFAFQSKDKLYMILDYVNGGELFTHLKRCGRFTEERARFYCAELCLALLHLHSNGIVYRDLKPENILLSSSGHIVLTDFGLSKAIGTNETHTFCGTPEYLAPEVLLGQGQSFPVDWWSLGTLTYEMMCGLPPFFSEIQSEMYDLIVNGELAFPESISDNACDFLAGLLEKDPEQRLLPEEIKIHPWFEGLDWAALEKGRIEPLWKPPVKDNYDYTQFDEEVINEPAKDSLPCKSLLQDAGGEDEFEGFTFDRKEGIGNTLNNG